MEIRGGGVVVFAAFTAAAVMACGGKPPNTKNALTHSAETWCPDGFEQGPQDTCFAIPEQHDKDTPILVYLHGMFVGHGSPEEWRVVREATGRGFAVVIPRGKRGLCAWKAELSDHFCWPQEPEDPQSMKAIIAEWERVLWQVNALLEGGTHKKYVLAYSNGGFFASYVATHGLFQGQAYAIVNGGPLAPPASTSPVPMLLVSGLDDAYQVPKMRELHEQLAKAGWAHAYCARTGGHGLLAADVEAALRFFKRDAEGGLKAQTGGYACDGELRPAAPQEAPAPAPSASAPPTPKGGGAPQKK